MDEDQSEGRLLAGFERYQEFLNTQNEFLQFHGSSELNGDDLREGDVLLKKLSEIFDEYQEQPYLLDPYLENLVAPVVTRLKKYARNAVHSSSSGTTDGARVSRLANLLYYYIKFRGFKTITRFFPHEIADLSIALDYLLYPGGLPQEPSQWPLRYVMLLWLSLICMLPFDLEQFDEQDQIGQTASRIETVAKLHLNKAGIERDSAAILLARLYMRKDMQTRLIPFVQWSSEVVKGGNDSMTTMGALRVLCEVAKSGPPEQIQAHVSALLTLSSFISSAPSLMNNTLVRKLRTKLISRIILRLLPLNVRRARKRGKALASGTETDELAIQEGQEIDVPEETETVLEELLQSLQDKDTIVRYSSAKGIARIAERLSPEFTEQVLDTILQLFSIHSIAVARIYEMPAIAEATWHGACLACAELARRGLVADDRLADLIEWLGKALYFDIRQGAHSVGSSVRDAASYVLWSLARAQSPAALSPFIMTLAQRLVTVSLFDREVHIRRAASAAFQEYVGRTGLFPHGIDVLRKTDFYAVGTRRHAFLVAATEVAEHEEYRPHLVDHLISVTLRHWDPAMRRLGAQSLREISNYNLASIALSSGGRVAQYLTFPDIGDVHGALLALTELAAACRDASLEEDQRKLFSYLSQVPSETVQSPRHEIITAAACQLIANGITLPDVQARENSSQWRRIVEFALRSRSVVVQEAAAEAMLSVSKLADLIHEANNSPAIQQSVCRLLGVLDYNAHPHGLNQAIQFLLDCVDRHSTTFSSNVDARRNAYTSMPKILANIVPRLSEHVSSGVICQMVDALITGLEDYTTDERGDVGSWIRMVCVQGLADFSEILVMNAARIEQFATFLPPVKYHTAVGGILKQGIERLDNVRQQAGQNFLRLLLLPLPETPDPERWRIHGEEHMKKLFLSDGEMTGWNEGAWLFPKAVHLLDIEQYREPVLYGLVLSASSRTDSTQRPVSNSLVNYAIGLSLTSTGSGSYSLRGLAQDLIAQASRNLASNAIVVPVLQTFNVLLEVDAFERFNNDLEGLKSLRRLLLIASRNVSKLKNVQRILMSMRIVINLLPMADLYVSCVAQLSGFLAHQYPKIRTDTAEYLYLVLQSKDLGHDTEEAEDIILETEWSSSDISSVTEAAQLCTQLLSQDSSTRQ